MFVYTMIGFELALLYVVFWYLFLRKPRRTGRVTGETWGAYDLESGTARGVVVPQEVRNHVPRTRTSLHADRSGCDCPDDLSGRRTCQFTESHSRAFIVDRKTGAFTPASRPAASGLKRWFSIFEEVDDKLSELNIRP